jgi:lipoate-protein ligase A
MKEDTPDTIILVSPNAPYVCIGYHQDIEKEVDLEYCKAHGLPVYRREVGGGAVYLDNGQLFTQWIFHKEDLPVSLEERFKLYIDPLVAPIRRWESMPIIDLLTMFTSMEKRSAAQARRRSVPRKWWLAA